MNAPLAYRIDKACEVSGFGKTKLYEEIGSGRLRAVKVGRRTLIPADDLRAFIESLPPIACRAKNAANDGPMKSAA
jgi:excisionase family DNA binding protein